MTSSEVVDVNRLRLSPLECIADRLDAQQKKALYKCGWSCKAVLRLLTPVARSLVWRAVALPPPVDAVPPSKKEGNGLTLDELEAVSLLKSLGILQEGAVSSTKLALDPTFREALLFDGLGKDAAEAGDATRPREPFEELNASSSSTVLINQDGMSLDPEKQAREKWDNVLQFLVDGGGNLADANFLQLFAGMGLISSAPKSGTGITKLGLDFILLDVYHQVWAVVESFALSYREPQAVLRAMFRLSFCRRNTRYLRDAQEYAKHPQVYDKFVALGLIVPESDRKTTSFLITSLGMYAVFEPPPMTLTKSAAHQAAEKAPGDGGTGVWIVVETTFKVYAYTESEVYLSILRLFIEIEAVLPNLVVGTLTRTSIAGAVQRGVTAAQILAFLTKHAYPVALESRRADRVVPENVSDQVMLWERERSRLTFSYGKLFSAFVSREAFQGLRATAGEDAVWVDDRPGEERMYVRSEGVERVEREAKEMSTRRYAEDMNNINADVVAI